MSTFNFILHGRIVQGHPSEGRTIDYQTKQPKERPDWYIGLAVPKNDQTPPLSPEGYPQGLNEALRLMGEAAAAGFPNGEASRSNFAWKYVDGDAPENATKEGHAGHWIFKLATSYAAPKLFRQDNTPILENPNGVEMKRGDHVEVFVSCKGNNAPANHTPGLYLNPDLIRLKQKGDPINSGPGVEVFGAAGQIPAGQNGAMPGMPGQMQAAAPAGMPQAAPPMQPAPGQMQAAAPAPQAGMPQAAPVGAPIQQQPQGMPQAAAGGNPPAQAVPGMAAPAQQGTFVPQQAVPGAPNPAMAGGAPAGIPTGVLPDPNFTNPQG